MNFVRTVAFALFLRGRGTTGAFIPMAEYPVSGGWKRMRDRRISQEPHPPGCLFGLFSDGEALGSFPQWLAQWLVARARYRRRKGGGGKDVLPLSR